MHFLYDNAQPPQRQPANHMDHRTGRKFQFALRHRRYNAPYTLRSHPRR